MKNSSLRGRPTSYSVVEMRREFPMLTKKIKGKPFIYFDNAASGQKPKVMIDLLSKFYLQEYGKPDEEHRLGKKSTGKVVGEILLSDYKRMLTKRTKIVSISHTSHVLGTILPVKKIIALAHEKNIPVLIDGAQTVPHMPVNVKELDCDFYTFSAHKMGGCTGLGILYGKRKWLNALEPLEGGSDMAKKVSFKKIEYASLPKKFEAGTLPFAEIIAFTAVLDLLQKAGMQKLFEYEQQLLLYATKKLQKIKEVNITGTSAEKEAVLSFYLDMRNKTDEKNLEEYLSDSNIFVKAGDLNAQPLLEQLGIKALVRISFSYYNTTDEIDQFITVLQKYFSQHK